MAVALLTAGSCQTTPAASGSEEPADDEEAEDVQVWLTTPDQSQLLSLQTLSLESDAGAGGTIIEIDEERTYQSMVGFGAAFTNASTFLIHERLSESQRETLLRSLFSREDGIGLSAMRHVGGSSEFALRMYTYDDLPPGETDPELEQFSIEPDLAFSIPVLQQAAALNPDLTLMGTIWSPPAWMKTSDSLIGGELRPEFYGAWARYLVRMIEAYADVGLEIDVISPQNEPLFVPHDYPGMFMTAEVQAELIRDHLGPALEAAGLDTRILVLDHNWSHFDFALTVLADEEARRYAAGTAFHCYEGSPEAQAIVHDAYPDKEIWVSECTGLTTGVFDLDLRWQLSHLVIRAARNWARAAMLWNLALDETSGPRVGGCANCRGVVTIEQATGAVTYNPEYYVLGHASRAADPGAVRVESESPEGALEHVAFRNPDGELGLLVLNNGAAELTFQVRAGADAFTYTLPGGAVATFRWPSGGREDTADAGPGDADAGDADAGDADAGGADAGDADAGGADAGDADAGDADAGGADAGSAEG